MSRSLIISFSGKMLNPSKMELISLSNLVWNSPKMQEMAVNYTFTEGNKIISTNEISRRTYNLQLINHLSCIDYSKEPFDMGAELKRLF